MKGQLVLVDASTWAYRYHFGMPGTTSRVDGEPNGGICGFCDSLWRLRSGNATHAAIVFDAPGPTHRHTSFPEYKANRKPKPDELVRLLKQTRDAVAAFGLPTAEHPGFEADDVLATLAYAGIDEELEVTVVCPDKDLLQIIRPGIRIIGAGRQGFDRAEVIDKFGVTPEQIPDYLAIVGDPGDNIPGVDKVGEVGAKRLLQAVDNLDTLYSLTNEGMARLPAAARQVADRVLAAGETPMIYRELATLRQVPDVMPVEAMELKRKAFDRAKVAAYLRSIDHPVLLRAIREATREDA